ncbi:MAG: nucleotidyltransferase family protein [Rubrivivax sp.]|nr:nucleotidyltransferase family protein [Rubrivivax sp.]
MMPPPVVVVLAAGRGTRFDGQGHKLTQPFTDASVLGTTLSRVIQSRLPLVVVTTEALQAEACRLVAQRDVLLLPNAEVHRGMARSIVAGVSARADASGWLILPADMPLVQPETLRAVAAALPGHACVVPYYGGRRGHPVGFSAELFSELLALSGDEGARRLPMRYPARALELQDPGVLVDIDTQRDLLAARELAARSGPDGRETTQALS